MKTLILTLLILTTAVGNAGCQVRPIANQPITVEVIGK